MIRKILFFFFGLSSIALANIANGPYLQNVTPNSITIMWLSEEDATGFVEYGETTNYGRRISGRPEQLQNESMWVYELTLTQLSANTTYHYQVTSGSSTSQDFTFKTAGSGNRFKFAVFGDIQRRRNHSEIAQNIVADEAEIIVSVGDLPAHGDELEDWQMHFFHQANAYLPIIPFYATIGNHDLMSNGLPYYQQIFSLPTNGEQERYYHFDYKNAKYIIIDSFYDFSEGSMQYNWLENVLQQNSQQWTFVFFHKPAYSSGPDEKIDHNAQRYLVPLFEKYNVDIVFSGHSHNYERSLKDGVYYIVTGGGGASLKPVNETDNPFQIYAEATHHHILIEINGNHLEFGAIAPDRRQVDSFSLNKSETPSEPVLAVDPTFLDFGMVETERNFNVTNDGDAVLNWRASENPEKSWITSISPKSGFLEPYQSESVQVTVNRTGLTDGDYSAAIWVDSDGGEATVSLEMAVSPTTPLLAVEPDEIAVSAFAGGSNPPATSITVTNRGGGTISWTASEYPEVAWMNLQNTSGSVGDAVQAEFFIDGLKAGTYGSSVRITDSEASNSPVDVPVVLTISPEQSGEILAECEAESSLSLPNPGWEITTNENAECLLAIVNSSGRPVAEYQLNYQFNIPEGTSTVYVFGEVDVNANTDQDSYWIEMNGGERCNWNGLRGLGNGWRRSWVYDRGQDNQHAFPVHSGANTLSLFPREKGAFINWLVVTTNEHLNIEEYIFDGEPVVNEPALAVNPTELEFTATENGADPAAHAITVSNAGGGTLSWEATAVPAVDWMRLTNPAGSDGDTVTVSISVAGLSAGEYQSNVEIRDPNASNSPVTVPVQLTIKPASVEEFPEIVVEPAELIFSAIEDGSNPGEQKITINNSGTGTLAWEAAESPSEDWMSLENTTGGDGDFVQVSVNIAGMAKGSYSGTVEIRDLNAVNSPVAVPVNLNISPPPITSEILAECEAESSLSLPNPGWEVTVNEEAECVVTLVKSRFHASSSYQLDYSFEVPEDVTSVYVFAEVDVNASRSEDSFWISMNEQEYCAWKDLACLGNGWKRAWVYNSRKDETQHAFRVTAGLNTLNVYPRVAGAFLNWLVITTNPEIDIENYELSGTLAKKRSGETPVVAFVPPDFQLRNNFPNPFNATTQVSINLPDECNCSIDIYNTLGQRVRTLFKGTLAAGQHQITWNGTDQQDQPVMTGLYFCLFRSHRWNQTIKMMLLE